MMAQFSRVLTSSVLDRIFPNLRAHYRATVQPLTTRMSPFTP
jgi:hypothetical protein